MSILFSGDFRADKKPKYYSITKDKLIEKYGQENYDRLKYHIILGDGGFMWPGKEEINKCNIEMLAGRPFPVLCVIGDKDPALGMKNVPETDIGIGETVYQIQDKPFIAYLKRGKVYIIDGFKFLVLGGALSPEKKHLKPNETWWEREYWSEEEKKAVFKLLETENNFDCILSHTGPHRINELTVGLRNGSYMKLHDEVADFNDEIHERIDFREWWCGHWQQDIAYYYKETNRNYRYLYQNTQILERHDNQMIVR